MKKNMAGETFVNALLAKMTIEEKVAQLSCIMPSMLMGTTMPDPALMQKYLPNGLGRMTQFASTFLHSPVDVARCANRIQQWVKNHTRLGIPVLFQNEAISGFSAIDATIFPSPISMASTWHPELIEEAAGIIRDQMKAVGVHKALSPVLDVAQDPRWGRLNETYGEDPYLCARIGTSYVHGLQTDNVRHGVAACGKHFLGYSVTLGGLNLAEVNVTERDLLEIFAFPFDAAIKNADMKSIMVTYSAINGIPVSINQPILRGLLRERMGFQGNVLCDGGSIEMCVTHQHVCSTQEEAGIQAIEAGLDANTPVTEAYRYLPQAVRDGKLKEAYLDEAVKRVLTLKYELGLFENCFVDEDRVSMVFSQKRPQHDAVAQQIAEESLILLKNEGGLLPLSNEFRKIAVIGPHAASLRAFYSAFTVPASVEMYQQLFRGAQQMDASKTSMGGISEAVEKDLVRGQDEKDENYGFNAFFHNVSVDFASIDIDQFIRSHYATATLLEAIEKTANAGVEIAYAKGCDFAGADKRDFQAAIKLASVSDVVVLTLGDISGWVTGTAGEGHDSTSLQLPGVQQELLEAIHAVGKPVVLLLFDARPHDLLWANANIPAILEVWTTGPRGAEAIAHVLFGLANPSGKLPLSIPRSVGQIPVVYNHRIASGYHNPFGGPILLRDEKTGGYVNEPASPLYHFGHGLSYSTFEYSDLSISPDQIDLHGSVGISAKIKNSSTREGQEVVQLYMFDREAPVTRPVKKLIGFRRIRLQPSETKEVQFAVDVRQFAILNRDFDLVVEPGNIEIMLGSSSADIRLKGNVVICGEEPVRVNVPVFFSTTSEK